jgi:hypothetical protein
MYCKDSKDHEVDGRIKFRRILGRFVVRMGGGWIWLRIVSIDGRAFVLMVFKLPVLLKRYMKLTVQVS